MSSNNENRPGEHRGDNKKQAFASSPCQLHSTIGIRIGQMSFVRVVKYWTPPPHDPLDLVVIGLALIDPARTLAAIRKAVGR